MKLGYSILPWQSLLGLSENEAIDRGCADIRAAGLTPSSPAREHVVDRLRTASVPFAEWPSPPRVVSDVEIFGWVASFGRAARETTWP